MVSIGLSGVTLERAGKELVARVHLTVGPGELVLVTGGRGAGKSLLLAAAAGALSPREGAVSIAGRELGSLQASARPYVRRNIGYLPADPPFSRDETALENVILALAVRGFHTGEAELIARRALAELGADGFADREVTELSVGERRLVALARALAGPPPIAVLDEPSAGLGGLDRDRVIEALTATRAAGAAILCASNDAMLVEALRAGGARHLELADGTLTGDKGVVRVLTPIAGTREVGRGAVVIDLHGPKREVS